MSLRLSNEELEELDSAVERAIRLDDVQEIEVLGVPGTRFAVDDLADLGFRPRRRVHVSPTFSSAFVARGRQ